MWQQTRIDAASLRAHPNEATERQRIKARLSPHNLLEKSG
jgi:hypothetical protein